VTQAYRIVDFTHLLTERWRLSDILLLSGAAKSRSEAKRLIKQGAVDLRDDRESAPTTITRDRIVGIKDAMILHVGKRFWRQLRLTPCYGEVDDAAATVTIRRGELPANV